MLRQSLGTSLAAIVCLATCAGCSKKEHDANQLADVKSEVDLTFQEENLKAVRILLEKKDGYYFEGTAVTERGDLYSVLVKPENKIRGRVKKWFINIKRQGEAMPDRELLENKFRQLIEKDYKSMIKTFDLLKEAKEQKYTGHAQLANGTKMQLMAGWVEELDFNGNKTGRKEFVFDTKPDGQNDIRRFAEISFDELLNR